MNVPRNASAKGLRFNLQEVMIGIGVLGVVLELIRSPAIFVPASVLLILVVAGCLSFGRTVRRFVGLPLSRRLAIEIVTLIAMLAWSTLIWQPSFYITTREQCERLARLASTTTGVPPEIRVDLDREAAWFSRRSSALHRRGLWLGLTMGPGTADLAGTGADLVYELGTIESIEKHQKEVYRLLAERSWAPPSDGRGSR